MTRRGQLPRQPIRFTLRSWMKWVAVVALFLGLSRQAMAGGIRKDSHYFAEGLAAVEFVVIVVWLKKMRWIR